VCLFVVLLPVFLYLANREQFLGIHTHAVNHVRLGLLRAGTWGGFAVCVVGLVTQLDLKHPINWPGFSLLVGDASYSIYLIAPLVMPVLHTITSLVTPNFNPPPAINGAIYILGTVLGGLLLSKYFEVPASRWTKKFLQRFVPPANPQE
jgi:peptidoglycan/LPS O-acetylase OafA/YrhL